MYGCVPGADEFVKEKSGIGVGLGNFDGVHLGHAALITALNEKCREFNIPSLIYTFANHPDNVLFTDKPTQLIVTNAKKASIMKEKGVDGIYFERFNCKYASMSAEDFVRIILRDRLGAGLVVIGHNYSFGEKGAGSPELLRKLGKKYGFETIIIPPVKVNNTVVSSTLLRSVIGSGEVEKYPVYTGRRYSLPGVVEHGRHVGQSLGFPTANILPQDGFALPASGVYITETLIGGVLYSGITNIGDNPTFDLKRTTVETHLFNYGEDLYGQSIEVFFIKKLRGEVKFQSSEALMAQVRRDISAAVNYFSDRPRDYSAEAAKEKGFEKNC